MSKEHLLKNEINKVNKSRNAKIVKYFALKGTVAFILIFIICNGALGGGNNIQVGPGVFQSVAYDFISELIIYSSFGLIWLFFPIIDKELKIMDMTAFTLCKENDIPIVVLDINDKNSLENLVDYKDVGTIVS